MINTSNNVLIYKLLWENIEKYSNEDLLEELGYSLIVEDTVDSLKLAFICYSLLYEKGDFKSLNPMLVIVCRLQELLEDGYFHDIENDIKKVIL